MKKNLVFETIWNANENLPIDLLRRFSQPSGTLLLYFNLKFDVGIKYLDCRNQTNNSTSWKCKKIPNKIWTKNNWILFYILYYELILLRINLFKLNEQCISPIILQTLSTVWLFLFSFLKCYKFNRIVPTHISQSVTALSFCYRTIMEHINL